MDAVERLTAMEAIRDVKARYFRAVDTQDWDVLARLFTADAVLDFSDAFGPPTRPERVLRGIDAIVDYLRRARTESTVTVHHGHTVEFERLSSTSALATWAMDDRARWRDDATGEERWFHGFGHYHDEYLCLAGTWRIRSSRISRLHLDRS